MIKISKIEDKDQAPVQKKSLNLKKLKQAKKLQKENEVEEEENRENVKIDGMWYQYLVSEASDLVEKTYQQYLKSPDKPHTTYIEAGNDLYEVSFSKKMQGYWQIVNTETMFSRHLVRKYSINGPFYETKTLKWNILEADGT